MTGRILVSFLLLATVLAGVGTYYFQVYGFYDELPAQDTVRLTAAGEDAPQAFAVRNFQGIDSDSSPIRYRACFDIDVAAEELVPYTGATPLNAPNWFDCFDAGALTVALRDNRAQAFMAEGNISYGIDRVVVLMDGRGYAWHQINPCGEAHFDGDPVPRGCPPPPERRD